MEAVSGVSLMEDETLPGEALAPTGCEERPTVFIAQ